MPLKGIPATISPELLYAIARMGHGDHLVIADANFPSDSVSRGCAVSGPIRVLHGNTAALLEDLLSLLPLDTYCPSPICMMDRVDSDKDLGLVVPTYDRVQQVLHTILPGKEVIFYDRFEFYRQAAKAFCIVQTNDSTPYANIMVTKGVL